MNLTSKKVEEIFIDCLFKDGENTTNHIKAEGIINNYSFNPDRLKAHEQEIIEMLNELPSQFKEEFGSGWSFLQACVDNNGLQWTDSHMKMEQLFSLGIGIGMVQCLLPRELWKMLPGGMPYYMIK